MLTHEGKWYVGGGLVIVALLLVIWLWALLVWIGLGVALVALVIIGWRVWGIVQHRRIEHRKAVAAAVKAEAEAEQAQAEASERRARAALKRAEVEAARARVHLIPEGYVGAQVIDPTEAESAITSGHSGKSAHPSWCRWRPREQSRSCPPQRCQGQPTCRICSARSAHRLRRSCWR